MKDLRFEGGGEFYDFFWSIDDEILSSMLEKVWGLSEKSLI